MADISTGRQRGIVPFVDETTGRLPDQYLPQGVIDLQGDLEQAVTDASQSASAAKASETAAKTSADSATQSASAAAQSAESASGDAAAAKASADGAASSASAAKSSETAAASSATAAAASASAAKASETAASQSAQTATEQVSSIGDSVERAAASATAAQQAVDGFGLEAGTTTTGEPGTNAAVSIAKQGTKYVVDFTIPRGEKGEQGASGINSVLTNTTLTGDGTSSNPLGISPGTFINPISVSGDGADANLVESGKIYEVNGKWRNLPDRLVGGYLLYGVSGNAHVQFLFAYTDANGGANVYIRQSWAGVPTVPWQQIIKDSDLSSYVPLSTYQALEARVQALEAKLANK